MEQPVQTEMWKARSLEELVRILHRLFAEDKVSVEEVQALMESYESNPEEWLQYAKFDQYRYGEAPPTGHGHGAAEGGDPRTPEAVALRGRRPRAEPEPGQPGRGLGGASLEAPGRSRCAPSPGVKPRCPAGSSGTGEPLLTPLSYEHHPAAATLLAASGWVYLRWDPMAKLWQGVGSEVERGWKNAW